VVTNSVDIKNPNNEDTDLDYFEYWESIRSESTQDQSDQDDEIPYRIIQTQKSVNELLSIDYDSTTYYSDHLWDDCEKKITEIFLEESDSLVRAPMGSGKSTAFINASKFNVSKVIFVVPLKINDQQLSDRLKLISRRDLPDDQLTEILKNEHFIICVYESLSKIYAILRKLNDVGSWTVIFDEVHNFISQARMRQKVFRLIRRLLPEFKKTIFLTGTPEGVLNCLKTYSTKLVTHSFIKKVEDNLSGDLTLIPTSNNSFDILAQHLVNNPVNGLTIIAIEDKGLLIKLKDILTNVFSNSPTEIIHSDVKEGQVYSDLVETGLIGSHIKYLLTTSVISDGCDIDNENIEAFYSLGWNDLNKLRQMHSRFRKANGKIKYYDIFKEIADLNSGILTDIDLTFHEWSQSLQDNLPFFDRAINRIPLKDLHSHPTHRFYYQDIDNLQVDQFLIQYEIMSDFFQELRIMNNRRNFYSAFSKFKDDKLIIEKIDFNSKTNQFINDCFRFKRKQKLLVTLFNNCENASELLRKTSDDRFKTEKFSEIENSLYEL